MKKKTMKRKTGKIFAGAAMGLLAVMAVKAACKKKSR